MIHLLAAYLCRRRTVPRAAGPQETRSRPRVPVSEQGTPHRQQMKNDAMSFLRSLLVKGVRQKDIAAAIGRKPAVVSHFLGDRSGSTASIVDDAIALRGDADRLEQLMEQIQVKGDNYVRSVPSRVGVRAEAGAGAGAEAEGDGGNKSVNGKGNRQGRIRAGTGAGTGTGSTGKGQRSTTAGRTGGRGKVLEKWTGNGTGEGKGKGGQVTEII